jgi:catechol 2,3-dioxygenase-like lactoylglutathione lyase family enzyme
LFREVDNLLLRVDDLDAAIAFYRDGLGHPIVWRDPDAVGFALPDTDAELVVHLRIGPETDMLVENTDRGFRQIADAIELVTPGSVASAQTCLQSRLESTSPQPVNQFVHAA